VAVEYALPLDATNSKPGGLHLRGKQVSGCQFGWYWQAVKFTVDIDYATIDASNFELEGSVCGV